MSAAAKNALRDAQHLTTLAHQLADRIADLGSLVTEISDTREALRKRLVDMIQRGKGDDWTLLAKFERAQRAVAALTLSGHVLRALWDSRIGREGVIFGLQFFDIRPVAGESAADITAQAMADIEALTTEQQRKAA